jgi:hypothetical protein
MQEVPKQGERQTVDDALSRVNKLKDIIMGLIGQEKNNDKLIKNKLESIKSKITKLKELKDKMNTKMKILSTSYDKAVDLMKTTDNMEELYEPMNNLREQIYETIAFNEDELDSVIKDLDGLVRENQQQQQPSQQPQQQPSQQPQQQPSQQPQQGGKRKQGKKGKSINHKNKATKKQNKRNTSNKSRKH